MNIIYGVGASIVILGALFKLEHYPGASIMLIIGMGVEAVVFFISAFDFPEEDYDWERVYPALADDDAVIGETGEALDLSWQDSMKQLDGSVFGELSTTLSGLNTNVSKLSGVADAADATNSYASKIKEATTKIDSLNQSYSVAANSMGAFANAATDAKKYHEQVQLVTTNLQSLNSIYELELQDAKSHLKSLNQFYGSMTEAMNNMSEASKDAEAYKNGMAALNTNLTRLNKVYGSMLNAMSGGAK
ncbi:MAG: gliding motility protein GldL [Bacteroidia bacterium]